MEFSNQKIVCYLQLLTMMRLQYGGHHGIIMPKFSLRILSNDAHQIVIGFSLVARMEICDLPLRYPGTEYQFRTM